MKPWAVLSGPATQVTEPGGSCLSLGGINNPFSRRELTQACGLCFAFLGLTETVWPLAELSLSQFNGDHPHTKQFIHRGAFTHVVVYHTTQ